MPNTRFSQRLLTLKRNENPDPQEPAQHRPHGRKKVVQTLREVKNTNEKVSAVIENPETKNVKKSQKKALTHTERPITIQILQRQKRRRRKQNNGKITKIEEKLLKTKYSDKGSALFSSVNNLIKASNLSRKKVKHFLHTEPSYTKYRSVIRKTPRLKVIVYDIDEIWSLDLAFVDKLAQYNHDVKYLLVAVDCMSRYLRVQPLKSKHATTTAEAFKLMITTKQPEKVWVDKGTEFKGSFEALCKKKGINTYSTESEKKSAFAERNIRSLENLIYKYLEDKWIYSYIDKLQDFVNAINSRTKCVTNLAPNKVTKKDVPRLISLRAEQSLKLVRRPKLYVGDYVRLAKVDIRFRKGYKQSFTDEVFEVFDIPTRNPPTYNLIDSNREPIEGKFYESELIRVLEKDNHD